MARQKLKRVQLSTTVFPEVKEYLEQLAAKDNTTVANVLNEIVTDMMLALNENVNEEPNPAELLIDKLF